VRRSITFGAPLIAVTTVWLAFFLFTPEAQAVVCPEPSASGDYQIPYDCAFGGVTNDGVDAGNITFADNVTLTINSGQYIVFNNGKSINKGTGWHFSLGNRPREIVKSYLWAVDGDGDGYAAALTWYKDTDKPSEPPTVVRVSSLTNGGRTIVDCNDAAFSATNDCYSYSQSNYYAYSQADYYAQSTYWSYAYTQSNYYAQSTYWSYSYVQSNYYAQSSYWRYSYVQSNYYAQSSYWRYHYSQTNYYSYSQGGYWRYGYGQSNYACFLAGTKVLMADSTYKNIEEIQPGDRVMSYDIKQGEMVEDAVVKLLTHPDTSGGYIVINDSLKVTGNHRIWVASKSKWVRADDINIGDRLLGPNGQEITVSSREFIDGVNDVYNLSLPGDNHNYFTDDVLVHNTYKL